MELNIADRRMLLMIMPERGNEITIPLIRHLKKELIFSDRELTDINFELKWTCECGKSVMLDEIKSQADATNGIAHECVCGSKMRPTDYITWSDKADATCTKEISIEGKIKDVLLSTFQGMSNRDELTEPYYDLWQKVKGEA